MGGAKCSIPLAIKVDDLTADIFILNEFIQHELIARVAPALVPDLAELTSAIHRCDDTTRPFDCVGHHLFAIHMTARFESHHGVWRMPEIRRSHEDGIKIFLIQHLLRAEVAVDIIIKARFDCRKSATNPGLHYITGSHIPNAWYVNHGVEEHFLLFAAANEAHTDVITRGT